MNRPIDVHAGKILIVDDKEANVRLLERILKLAGYVCVECTTDPASVLELHEKNRYDLIMLDLNMPAHDGFEVMEDLKGIEKEGYVPVLVITAQPDEKLRALKAGARDFVSKPFEMAEVLARVHNLIEVRMLHMETKKLYERVLLEQQVSERLLLNVLPQSVAERLKTQSGAITDDLLEVLGDRFVPLIADSFPDVTVLFADIVGFTRFSADVGPERLVVFLNEIFTGFDGVADRNGIEKIKTIGDAYMAVAGLPLPLPDHAQRAGRAALEMMDELLAFNARNECALQMRIGLDSGPVVAGVIGKRKFIYDLWGDTVNTASRMESHGMPGKIQVTAATQSHLKKEFVLEQRNAIDVKGIGEMHTWFLNGACTVQSPGSVDAGQNH